MEKTQQSSTVKSMVKRLKMMSMMVPIADIGVIGVIGFKLVRSGGNILVEWLLKLSISCAIRLVETVLVGLLMKIRRQEYTSKYIHTKVYLQCDILDK